MDILSNKAANDYAEFLLENNEDPEKEKDFLNKHLIVGEVRTIVGVSMLEEEENEDKVLYNEFMDAHGLLCELEEERNVLLDPKYTHIGVGFAWSRDQVKVVEFLAVKPLIINQLHESEEGGVECRGMMIPMPNSDVGLYAARIVSIKNLKKDIKLVGPPNIHMDMNTK